MARIYNNTFWCRQLHLLQRVILGIALMLCEAAFDVRKREVQQEALQEAAAVVQSDLQRLQQATVVAAEEAARQTALDFAQLQQLLLWHCHAGPAHLLLTQMLWLSCEQAA